MQSEASFFFDSFRLDPQDARLFRAEVPVPLTPKSFSVLGLLLRNAGRLLTKEELIRNVWNDVCVSDASLKVCVREIRQALGDEAHDPRYIETVHRRGYRFIGKLCGPSVVTPEVKLAHLAPELETPSIVGREDELTHLGELLAEAQQGKRQVVFLYGEPGAGKTALVREFTRRAAATGTWVAIGQCFEQFATGEAFLPILEAVSRLCREPHAGPFVSLLASHAPTWLAQMPWLQTATGRDVPPQEVLGATAERMLREICEALEALTANTPLVLVLEDLHWSDLSTLDLLSALSRRSKPARLLLLVTFRPVDVILNDHPLRAVKQELCARRICKSLPLEPLSETAVSDYLAVRFPNESLPEKLTQRLFHRTQGNALFFTTLIDEWLAQGTLFRRDEQWELRDEAEETYVPEGIRALIDRRIGRLNEDEQQTVEAASAAGAEFSAALVAAALGRDLLEVESLCEGLCRRHLLLESRGSADWPDGTISDRYRFRHELYRHVLYDRLPKSRQANLHLVIGNRLEAAFGSASGDSAAELAGHFEHGRDFVKAIRYLRVAARNAARRGANREAGDYLGRALRMVAFLYESERPATRLALLKQQGLVSRGSSDMKAAAMDFLTMATESRSFGFAEQEAAARLYLASVLSWSDRAGCLKAVDEAVALIPKLSGSFQSIHIRGWAAYWNMLWRGWSDDDARHNAKAVEAARLAGDPAVLGQLIGRHSYFLSLSSRYDDASRAAEEGAELALAAGDVSEYLLCQYFRGWALLHAGRWGELQSTLRAGIETAVKNGHRPWVLFLRLKSAWLHEQSFDFEEARILGEATLNEAIELRVKYGEIVSLILLGFAHLGLRAIEDSLGYFNRASSQLDQGLSVLGTIWRMQLHLGIGECRMAQGDSEGARKQANLLRELAGKSGERTYLVHAGRLLAEAALAERDYSTAEEALKPALALAETTNLPLATRKLYATAWLLNSRTHPDKPVNYREREISVRQSLANSLGQTSPLSYLNSFQTKSQIERIRADSR